MLQALAALIAVPGAIEAHSCAELANGTRDTPPFVVAGLEELELTFRNAARLNVPESASES